MEISPDRLEEFTVLLEEFINSYPNTSKGIKHISSYSQQRESGRRNYQAILEAKEAGEDISDRVLLQLLPYRDTKNNRKQGAWIHNSYLTPSAFKKIEDNSSYATAEVFLQSINNFMENNNDLSKSCQVVSQSPLTRNWQANFITPILNAVKPDSFILINNKSRVVINHFADTKYSHKLIDYPAINKLAWQLIKDLSSVMDRFALPALRQDDLFDMFCHWLVAEKKYNFKSGLAEGENAMEKFKNTVKKSALDELNPEQKEPVLKANPNSHLSEIGLNILSRIKDDKFDNNYTSYTNNIKLPFVEVCEDVMRQLPSHITNKLDNHKIHIDSDINGIEYYKAFIYLDTQINFYIRQDTNNLETGICIHIDTKDLIKNNKLQQKIIPMSRRSKDGTVLPNIWDNFLKNDLEIEIDKIDTLRIYQLLPEISLKTYLDINSWVFDFNFSVKIEEVRKVSRYVLIDNICESFNYLYPIVLTAISENPEKEIEEHLKIWDPQYILEKYLDATYIEESQLKTWIKSITRKKQAIFYGSPGTGKTFIAENIAQYLTGGGDGFYELIQFHPAYSYEDFIQGIRPQTKDSGQLSYDLVPGRFLEFCNKAANCKDKCVLIVDEINRANLAEVFGELMYLLEYREQEICLAGSQEKFKIPDNVYLIGTMNTADRSIALVDFALRRRFAFIKISPNYDIITKFHQQHTKLEVIGLISVLQEINNLIEDENYHLGVSFFLIETLAEDLENIWQMEIEPYLEEYFYNRLDEIKQYQWENIKNIIQPSCNIIES